MRRFLLLALIAGCASIKQPTPEVQPDPAPESVICRFTAEKIAERGVSYQQFDCKTYWQIVEATAEKTSNFNLLFCYILDPKCWNQR